MSRDVRRYKTMRGSIADFFMKRPEMSIRGMEVDNPVEERVPLDVYRREAGMPFLSKSLKVHELYNGDDEIRHKVDEIEDLVWEELQDRDWKLDAASAQGLVEEMTSELGGVEHLDSYTKLDQMLALAKIYRERRKLGKIGRHLRAFAPQKR